MNRERHMGLGSDWQNMEMYLIYKWHRDAIYKYI